MRVLATVFALVLTTGAAGAHLDPGLPHLLDPGLRRLAAPGPRSLTGGAVLGTPSAAPDCTNALSDARCGERASLAAYVRRETEVQHLSAEWSERARQALAELQRAERRFASALARNEVDRRGADGDDQALAAAEGQAETFVSLLRRFTDDSGRSVALGSAPQEAESRLRATYTLVMAEPIGDGPVTRDGVRETQRAWLAIAPPSSPWRRHWTGRALRSRPSSPRCGPETSRGSSPIDIDEPRRSSRTGSPLLPARCGASASRQRAPHALGWCKVGDAEMTGAGSRIAALAFAAAMMLASAAVAEDYDAGTKTALQDIVSKQLDAFGRGDGAAAEVFAAPAIREQFPDPAKFFAMVKDHYGALIKPKSTTFVGVESSPHGPLQKMSIVAADGTVWAAIYSFEKVEGEWRITGCALEEDKNQQAI